MPPGFGEVPGEVPALPPQGGEDRVRGQGRASAVPMAVGGEVQRLALLPEQTEFSLSLDKIPRNRYSAGGYL